MAENVPNMEWWKTLTQEEKNDYLFQHIVGLSNFCNHLPEKIEELNAKVKSLSQASLL